MKKNDKFGAAVSTNDEPLSHFFFADVIGVDPLFLRKHPSEHARKSVRLDIHRATSLRQMGTARKETPNRRNT